LDARLDDVYPKLEVLTRTLFLSEESEDAVESLAWKTPASFLPELFRDAGEEYSAADLPTEVSNALAPAMPALRLLSANRLALVPEKIHHLRNHFLCTEISDADLPWDINEKDW